MANTKECTSCGITKELSKFHKNSNRKDGRDNRCKECKRTTHSATYDAERSACNRKCYLQRKYGITQEEYNELFIEQKGCCCICGVHQSNQTRNMAVDHSHVNGHVRGLLCQKCNTALGKFSDSIEVLKKAIDYLEEKGE